MECGVPEYDDSPLPEGPATLFHEDRMNNTVDFATNDFDLEGKYSLNRNKHIVIMPMYPIMRPERE